MSLQLKFLLLIGTLLLAVVGSVAAAWWSLRLVHSEVATPFRSVAQTLGELGRLKSQVEDIADVLAPPVAPTGALAPAAREPAGATRTPMVEDARNIAEAAQRARSNVANLERDDRHRQRIGLATWGALRTRTEAALVGASDWAASGEEQARLAALRECRDLRELIENTEARILDDAGRALEYSDQVRSTLTWWLGSVFLASALAGTLAVILLRRWVQRPVGRLREAAARIASGDFTYRLAPEGTDEMSRLMGEVNHMAGMVDRLQREAVERERLAAVGQMVRRIVHNVRNPLAGIRGLAEVTRLDMPAGTEGRENLTLIVNTVDSFEKWLTDLLESTRPLELRPRPVPLSAWVQGVVQTHLPAARAKGVSIEISAEQAPESVEIDARHMDHALAAVLANAIDAAPGGSAVRVVIAGAGFDQRFEVRVEDQGPGVPASLRGRIFEPHFSTKAHGTGIGLAIAQQIVKAHGGLITLDEAPKNGSGSTGAVFRIRLPVSPAQTGKNEVAENNHHSG